MDTVDYGDSVRINDQGCMSRQNRFTLTNAVVSIYVLQTGLSKDISKKSNIHQYIILKTLFIVTLRLCKEDHAMQQQPLPTLQHPKDARHFDKLRRLIIVLSRPWEKLEKGLMH